MLVFTIIIYTFVFVWFFFVYIIRCDLQEYKKKKRKEKLFSYAILLGVGWLVMGCMRELISIRVNNSFFFLHIFVDLYIIFGFYFSLFYKTTLWLYGIYTHMYVYIRCVVSHREKVNGV